MKNILLLGLLLLAASVSAQTIERIDTIRTVTEETVTDTVMNVSSHTDSTRVELPPVVWQETTRKGHYVQAGIGAGYGAMGFKSAHEGLSSAGLGVGMQHVQYAYFFHENFGVSLGVGASTYGGSSVLNADYRWNGIDESTKAVTNPQVKDDDGETYNHTTHVRDWTEQQRMWSVEAPISFQYQQIYSPKGGMYASVGVSVGAPVATSTRLTEGRLEHEGYYPWSSAHFNGTVNPWFATDRAGETFSGEKAHGKVFPLQTTVRGEIGWLYPVAPEWDIMLGAYARYTINNMRTHEAEPFGLAHADAHHDYTPFMQTPYSGMMNSELASALRPWQVGVHVGVQWHYHKTHVDPQERWDLFTVYDTTYQTVSRVVEHENLRFDTTYTAVQEIKRLMEKSIIWFDLNSSTPKLDPVDILDSIAAILVENPDLKIEVNGHTCTMGKQDYNLKLGARRADAVAKLLIKQGVKPEQITTHSYSSDKPFYSESHQLYLDRRVEIIPIEEGQE